MDTSNLIEQILSSDNLNKAYLQVVRKKGAEGVDGMKLIYRYPWTASSV